jgi:mannose-6-phosphate isomerase-like protein (cupin superfamily)
VSRVSYTRVNIADVEDMAPKFGMAPDVEARFARRPLECEQLGLSYQRLAPNARMPFGHKHAGQEEIYVILAGTMRAKLGDEIVELRERDLVRVAPDTMRSFEAGPGGAEFLAFGAPGSEPNDAEMVQGWWSD